MTSDNRTAANRANCKKSTGPRTHGGKAKVSRNALRHGLHAGSSGETGLSERIERLAKAICQDDAESASYRQALMIAESFVDITRVRAHRVQSLHPALPEILGYSSSGASPREPPGATASAVAGAMVSLSCCGRIA
jgi:hypothetical protein